MAQRDVTDARALQRVRKDCAVDEARREDVDVALVDLDAAADRFGHDGSRFTLFVIDALAKRIIPEQKAFVDCNYGEVLKLSFAYQGGVIAWVAFWAFYGQGFGAENMSAVASFGAAYLLVVLVEPIADLAVLAGAKLLRDSKQNGLFAQRLFNPA